MATKLSATQVYYLRTVHYYTEGEGDRYVSWTIRGWQRTEASLTRLGLLEDRVPEHERDRQSVQLTDAGRAALKDYEGRETTQEKVLGRRVYKTVWAQE